MNGWDDPATVARWQAFGERFDRYHRVNAALAEHAALSEGLRILDVGAGTGGAAAAVRAVAAVELTCAEPAAAMRDAASVEATWLPELPEGRFDRVLCGSSLWLQGPLPDALRSLRARLVPGGALVFAIPAAYLGEPAPPGGGPDPWLQALPAALVAGRTGAPEPGPGLPDADGVDAALQALGLRPERWSVTTRWTSASQAAWLALPPVLAAMRPDLAATGRDAALAAAVEANPGDSWRDERWAGWTAWAP